mgnify:CR=1 FL=1
MTTRNFFADMKGDQGSETGALLPTNPRQGAPAGSRYLLQFAANEVEVRQSGRESAHPGHPYLNFRAEVVEPADFEGRSLYGMLYYPADLGSNADEKGERNHARRKAQFIGACEAVLGEGAEQPAFPVGAFRGRLHRPSTSGPSSRPSWAGRNHRWRPS